jgi:hypothetical protein
LTDAGNLVDPTTGAIVSKLAWPADAGPADPQHAVFGGDGRLIVADAGEPNALLVFDARTGRPITVYSAAARPGVVALSSDGEQLAVATDFTIQLIRRPSGISTTRSAAPRQP